MVGAFIEIFDNLMLVTKTTCIALLCKDTDHSSNGQKPKVEEEIYEVLCCLIKQKDFNYCCLCLIEAAKQWAWSREDSPHQRSQQH